jgi:peptidoglycan/LPS O-acetylase OafA/YrhL
VALGYFATPDPRETSAGLDFLLALLPISNLYRLHYGLYGGALFSIAIELQFYLLFPAILIFVRRYGRWYVPTIICSLIGVRTLVYLLGGPIHDIAYFSLFGALDIFLIGMLAGEIYVQGAAKKLPGWAPLLAFIFVNAAVYVAHLHGTFFNFDFDHATPDGVSRSGLWIIWPTVEGLMFAAFALVYLGSRWQVPFADAFAYLGKISYSLYVWHTIVFMLAVHWRLRFLPPFEMGALVILPVSIGISALSYKLIEGPFLAMRVRYIRDAAAPTEGRATKQLQTVYT